jgi:hypothetical protein
MIDKWQAAGQGENQQQQSEGALFHQVAERTKGDGGF